MLRKQCPEAAGKIMSACPYFSQKDTCGFMGDTAVQQPCAMTDSPHKITQTPTHPKSPKHPEGNLTPSFKCLELLPSDLCPG